MSGPEPGLQERFRFSLFLGAPLTVGALATGGVRRMFPAQAGGIEGDGLIATVIPGHGGETHLERAGGTTVIEASYLLKDHTGCLIRMIGQGYATAAPHYPGTRMSMMFEVAENSTLAWLATRVFVGERPAGSYVFEVALVV